VKKRVNMEQMASGLNKQKVIEKVRGWGAGRGSRQGKGPVGNWRA
jgi:hypothetical protein